MSGAGRLLTLATGCLAFALALPVAAQDQQACPAGRAGASIGEGPMSGFGDSLPLPPCQEPALPPASPKPLHSKSNEFPAPAGEPLKSDFSVASTDLGFEKGIGPAPGYAISYRGKRYLVIEVKAADGGPSFSGGSRFVIGVKGANLIVGLAAIPSDKAPGLTAVAAANVVN
jgi:hypothetical protein